MEQITATASSLQVMSQLSQMKAHASMKCNIIGLGVCLTRSPT